MSRDVEFLVRLPQWSRHVSAESIREIAGAAEDLGFDGVLRGDHVVFPEGTAEVSPWSMATPAYDAFTVLSHVAGTTTDLRIGVNICVAPYRHPVVLSKVALSLDALSEGRLDLGVAPGWHEAEFEVLDVPFEGRGSRTDEFLELFERVQTDVEMSFDGPHHSFGTTAFRPRPVQDSIPVWIGGRGGASLRRVGAFGDGWTVGTRSPEFLRSHRDRLLDAWDDHGRRGDPGVAIADHLHVGSDPPDDSTDRSSDRPRASWKASRTTSTRARPGSRSDRTTSPSTTGSTNSNGSTRRYSRRSDPRDHRRRSEGHAVGTPGSPLPFPQFVP